MGELPKDPGIAASNNDVTEEAKKQFSQYDFIHFTMSDMHGISRSKIMTAKHAHKFAKKGTGIFSGMICGGPQTEDWAPAVIEDANFPNALMKPDLSTLHSIPNRSSKSEHRVGRVLCESTWQDGNPQAAQSRYLARRQVELLESEFKMRIMSAFEMEFMLLDPDTKQPTFTSNDYMLTVTESEKQEFFMDLIKQVESAGVEIEAWHTEHAPGQYEIVAVPAYGLKSADDCFLTKLNLKEMATANNLIANFMAKPDPELAGNGTHFNFSIWNILDGKSAFYDSTAENGLSNVARWWLGGMLLHFRGLSALLAPTVNCYRRFHKPWAPDIIDWGIDDRTVAVRVKTGGPNSTYMENRVPSGLCNPYIVLAGTLAAGMDGIRRQVEPPAPGHTENTPKLPYSLEEAIGALEEDSILVEAIGREFVEYFTGCKRGVELQVLKSSDPSVDDADAIANEFKEYGKFA